MFHPLPSPSTPRISLLLTTLLASAVALLAGAAHAQGVYRIVGADGRVTFSDRPINTATQPKLEAPGPSSSVITAHTQLPYELRQSVSRYPVTLYTTKECQPCDEARTYLQGRGVPFAERTVESSNDQAALKKLSGQDSLPFATIGSQHLKGFGNDSWGQYLNAAGYPSQSQLPKTYQAPAAKPLTTPTQTAAEKAAPTPRTEAAPTSASSAAPGTPSANNPAGLRF